MRSVVKGNTNRCILVLFRTLLFSQVAVRNSTTIAPKFASMKADLYFVRHGETEANRDNVLQGHCDFPLTDKGVKQCEQVGEALRSIRWSKVFSSDLPRTLRTSQILLSKSNTYNTEGKESMTADVLLREMNFGVLEMLPRNTSFETAIQIVAARQGIKFEDVVDEAETNAEVKIRQKKFITETLFSELVAQGFPRQSTDAAATSATVSSSTIEVDDRVKSEVEEFILSRKSDNPKILCVSHGGFIRRFLSNFCDLDYVTVGESNPYPGSSILSSVFGIKGTKLIRLSNCSISVVTIEWPSGGVDNMPGNFVCKAFGEEVNIIRHLDP